MILESTWATSQDPGELIHYVMKNDEPLARNERKGRLISAHLCKAIEEQMRPLFDPYAFDVRLIANTLISVAEDSATEEDINYIHGEIVRVYDIYENDHENHLKFELYHNVMEEIYGPWISIMAVTMTRMLNYGITDIWICNLIREIYNPFYTFDRSKLNNNLITIAKDIYSTWRFSYLPILADALEEIGYTGMILDHLRGDYNHVLGCWALDQILGKEPQ